jgi:WD40 repeat protein
VRWFVGHSGRLSSVCFSCDGKWVVTGSSDRTARLWDAWSGKELRRFEGHSDYVSSVSISATGSRLLTGSGDKTARLWDVQSQKELRRFEGHSGAVRCVCFAPDGKQVLTGSDDGTARLWDAATCKELRRFGGSDDQWKAVLGAGFLSVVLQQFRDRSDRVMSVCFSPDGKRVLTGSWNAPATLWDAQSGKELQRFEGMTFPVDPLRAVAATQSERVTTGE